MDLSLFPLRQRLAQRELSVVELVTEMLPRWRDAPRGVWIDRPDPERLLRLAADLDALDDAARALRPLFGVPIAVKDNIDVAGMPTTAGCPAFARLAERDAETVARLRAAGALIVGKTNLDQFATGLTGTRTSAGIPPNVFDPQLVPGGSSSGSAVAVASGLVTAALGTDTAGSGRVPAACNGIVGWKPAPGQWSGAGVIPACRSLDCVSVFTRTVPEAAAVAGVIGAATVTAHPGPYRVAVPDARNRATLAPETDAAFGAAIDRLATAGHAIVPIDVEAWFETGVLLYEGPWVAERTAAVGEFIAAHPDAVEAVVHDIIVGGATISAVETFRAFDRLDALRATVARWWEVGDVLLLPTVDDIPTVAAAVADPSGSSRTLGRLTNAANLLGLAAVSYPAGRRAEGRPFGLTAFAPPEHAALLAGFVGVAPGSGPSAAPPYDVAVVGAHLSGLPLNDRLTSRGARLLRATTTSERYRLHRLAGGGVPRPALERVTGAGHAIEVEVWRLGAPGFAALVAEIPPPLGIGAVELADGSWVRGFVCEPIGLADATDITASGGWRNHLRG